MVTLPNLDFLPYHQYSPQYNHLLLCDLVIKYQQNTVRHSPRALILAPSHNIKPSTQVMSDINITPIGILHCALQRREDTPKSFDESSEQGIIEIYPKYTAGLDGIKKGSTILVLFWFNQAKRDVFRVHPRGDTSRPICGVFATRSPMRPNPIAVSRLKVLDINGNKIMVQGLDAMDQTPVLDIKK